MSKAYKCDLCGKMNNEPTDTELNYLEEVYCESCKGAPWMRESGCYERCEGFEEQLKEVRREEMET